MGLSMSEYDGFLEQKGITQLMFQNTIILIFDTLLLTRIFKAPGIIEGSLGTLLFSYITTIFNLLLKYVLIQSRAAFFQEDLLKYMLMCLKAKYGWIPFVNQIKDGTFNQNQVDYNTVYCPLPLVSRVLGIYEIFHFEFTDLSIIQFVDAIKTDKLSMAQGNLEIKLGTCLSKVSIQGIGLLLATTAASNKISLNFDGMNWQKSIEIGKRLLKDKEEKIITNSNIKEERWDARSPFGDSIMRICIENGFSQNPQSVSTMANKKLDQNYDVEDLQSKQKKYEDLIYLLLDERTNPNIYELDGDTPLMYAIR